MRAVEFLKSIPIKYWIVIAVAIFFFWQHFSSWAISRKLYNIGLDQLRKDQSQVIQDKDEQLKVVREQSRLYQQQIKEVQKEKEVMKQRAIQSEAKIAKLEGENDALRKKIDSIVVSNDPDRITDDLNKMGYGPIERVR